MEPLNMKDGGIVGKVSDWITETTGIETPGLDRRIETPGLEKAKNAAWAAVDFVPIIGDIKGAWELTQEVRKDPINWVAVGALTAGLVIGLVPGVGDAIAGLLKRSVQALGQAGILTANNLVTIFKAAKTGDEDLVRAEIERLTKLAESKGWNVRTDSTNYKAEIKADGTKEIYIPAGFSKQELLIALEEFSHALEGFQRLNVLGNYSLSGQQIIGGARLAEEIRAKTTALQRGSDVVGLTDSEITEWAKSFRGYLTIPFEWKEVVGYSDDAIKQLQSIDDDVWKLIEVPKPDIAKLRADDAAEWASFKSNLEAKGVDFNQPTISQPQFLPDGVTLAARSATPRPFFIKNADGAVEEVSMTPAEFREVYGVGSSAVKKPRGRTGDGLQWSKDPEGFGDKRTASGNALIDTQVERLEDVSLADATSAKRYLPRSLSDDDKLDLKMLVDAEVADQASKYADEMDILNKNKDDLWFDPNDGWVSSGDTVDYNKTKDSALEISEESWPNIKMNLEEQFSHLSTEEYNKVLNWARSRSRNAFNIRKAGAEGEMYTQRMGAVDRLRALEETGSDQLTFGDKIEVRSGGMSTWVDQEDFEAILAGELTSKQKAHNDWLSGLKKSAEEAGIKYGNHDPEAIDFLVEDWKNTPTNKRMFKTEERLRDFVNTTSEEFFDDLVRIAEDGQSRRKVLKELQEAHPEDYEAFKAYNEQIGRKDHEFGLPPSRVGFSEKWDEMKAALKDKGLLNMADGGLVRQPKSMRDGGLV